MVGGGNLNFSFWGQPDAHSLRYSLRLENSISQTGKSKSLRNVFLKASRNVLFGAIYVVLSHLILKAQQHLCLVKSPVQILIQLSSSTSPSSISFQS